MSANQQNILARIIAHNYLTCTIHFHLSDFLCINNYSHNKYEEGFALQCFIITVISTLTIATSTSNAMATKQHTLNKLKSNWLT